MSSDFARKLTVVTPASSWPITKGELKAQIRQSSSMGADEDDLLDLLIAAACTAVENHCGLSMAVRTLRMSLTEFPSCPVVLWYPFVTAVTALEYYDGDNALQTVAPSYYDAELDGLRPTVSLSWGSVWPVRRDRPYPVRITYTTAESVDPTLKLAALMTAADYYENREAQITSQYFGERSVIQNPAVARMLNASLVNS